MTACRCLRCSVSVASRYSARTISRVVKAGNCIRGWLLLFEGDEDTPSPSASTAMTKHFAGSTSFSVPTLPAIWALVPVNQDGKSTALEPSALSFPQVR